MDTQGELSLERSPWKGYPSTGQHGLFKVCTANLDLNFLFTLLKNGDKTSDVGQLHQTINPSPIRRQVFRWVGRSPPIRGWSLGEGSLGPWTYGPTQHDVHILRKAGQGAGALCPSLGTNYCERLKNIHKTKVRTCLSRSELSKAEALRRFPTSRQCRKGV